MLSSLSYGIRILFVIEVFQIPSTSDSSASLPLSYHYKKCNTPKFVINEKKAYTIAWWLVLSVILFCKIFLLFMSKCRRYFKCFICLLNDSTRHKNKFLEF